MVTQEEFTALTQLLQRTLMSAAEAQWTKVFMARLQATLVQQARAGGETQGGGQQRVPGTERVDDVEPEGAPKER